MFCKTSQIWQKLDENVQSPSSTFQFAKFNQKSIRVQFSTKIRTKFYERFNFQYCQPSKIWWKSSIAKTHSKSQSSETGQKIYHNFDQKLDGIVQDSKLNRHLMEKSDFWITTKNQWKNSIFIHEFQFSNFVQKLVKRFRNLKNQTSETWQKINEKVDFFNFIEQSKF